MSKPSVTREMIIREIQRIAREEKIDTLTQSDFKKRTGISDKKIHRYFDGWREACQVAGLKPNRQGIRLDDGVLFEEMRRAFLECESVCTRAKFDRVACYSPDTYESRFGRWKDVLRAFQKWVQENNAEFPLEKQLQLAVTTEVKLSTSTQNSSNHVDAHQWKSCGGTTYGSFLNFRGLPHAPINEQGVVFLFGRICFELGFVVEAVRTSYPDCEAKRRVDRQRDKWERVKIEFELKSSTFKEHLHDPKGCDLIVCWEHDWPECPLEVVELRSEISKLPDKAGSPVAGKAEKVSR